MLGWHSECSSYSSRKTLIVCMSHCISNALCENYKPVIDSPTGPPLSMTLPRLHSSRTLMKPLPICNCHTTALFE